MKKGHNLSQSEVIGEIPRAGADELAAVEFLEKQRWGDTPACIRCGSVDVYKMADAKTGKRNERFLWRCRDCKGQYTVRIGTVYEESRIELRHWCYAFWRACTSKGVAALEIKRRCQINHKSALFLMARLRFATPFFSSYVSVFNTLKLQGDWRDAVKKYLRTKKPASGCRKVTARWEV